jgi:predicted lipoprotein with Yx(FWY)xxD motif
MKRLIISGAIVAVALAVGIAIAVAATSGGSKSSPGAPAASKGRATVSAKQISGTGSVLVDAKGRALYTNDQESRGMVLCKGTCVSFWIPLTISGGSPKGDSLSGKLGVVRRPGGSKQVTYNGKLLYTFYLDKPGKVGGDGFADAFGGQKFTWHVVHANGATTSPNTGQGSNQSGGGYFSY